MASGTVHGVERESHLEQAARHAELGLPVPDGARRRFAKRLVLKSNWFVTRRQMDFNLAMVAAMADLESRIADLADLEVRVATYRHHVAQVLAGIEASLRAEILGSDRRGDRLETDLVRLAATVTALQAQLDSMAGELASTSSESVEAEVAGVRSLPGSIRK